MAHDLSVCALIHGKIRWINTSTAGDILLITWYCQDEIGGVGSRFVVGQWVSNKAEPNSLVWSFPPDFCLIAFICLLITEADGVGGGTSGDGEPAGSRWWSINVFIVHLFLCWMLDPFACLDHLLLISLICPISLCSLSTLVLVIYF